MDVPAPIYLTIIIPTFNEKENLVPLLRLIENQKLAFPYEILLMDSGSTDGSAQLIRDLAKTNSLIQPIFLEKNFGKGYCVRKGLERAQGSIVLIQDADLEYDPADYHKILKHFEHENVQFVLGTRRLGPKSWRFRTQFRNSIYLSFADLGSEFLTRMFRLLYRCKISDAQTMFKVFRKSAISKISLSSNGFDLDCEILCKLVRQGHYPVEVPVSYQARTPNEGKKLRLFRDGFAAMAALVRYRFADE